MKQDLKPPFYWERQMARIGRAMAASRVATQRHQPRRRSMGAGFNALAPRIIDLGRADYCEA